MKTLNQMTFAFSKVEEEMARIAINLNPIAHPIQYYKAWKGLKISRTIVANAKYCLIFNMMMSEDKIQPRLTEKESPEYLKTFGESIDSIFSKLSLATSKPLSDMASVSAFGANFQQAAIEVDVINKFNLFCYQQVGKDLSVEDWNIELNATADKAKQYISNN